MARPYRCSRPLLAAMVAWALFVWATRIRNALGDHDASAWSKTGAVALSVSFVVFALVGIVILVRSRKDHLLSPVEARSVQVFAAWTTVVWLVFGTIIVVHHHPIAFKAVHVTLGLISIGLSAALWRSTVPVEASVAPDAVAPGRSR
jgi:hypothetical protein